jgi:hypothetical protein
MYLLLVCRQLRLWMNQCTNFAICKPKDSCRSWSRTIVLNSNRSYCYWIHWILLRSSFTKLDAKQVSLIRETARSSRKIRLGAILQFRMFPMLRDNWAVTIFFLNYSFRRLVYWNLDFQKIYTVLNSVAEPHHFYAAPGKKFYAAPAAPAPTLLYSWAKFL